MENTLSAPEYCPACSNTISVNDVFCQNCGYPLQGEEQEQKNFLLNREIAQIDLDGYHKKIIRARNWFYYLAGLFTVIGLITFFKNKDSEDVLVIAIPEFILSVCFLVLGSYSIKKPLACIISGLCLYIIVQILNFIADPALIARGIVFKIFVIAMLINGIKSAIEIEKIRKEHPSI